MEYSSTTTHAAIEVTPNEDERIRELRERQVYTQEDLAEMVGVTRQTMFFREKGTYNPSLRLAHRIARVFGLKIDDVFSFEDGCD